MLQLKELLTFEKILYSYIVVYPYFISLIILGVKQARLVVFRTAVASLQRIENK